MKFEKSMSPPDVTIGDLVDEATSQGKILVFNTLSLGVCLAVRKRNLIERSEHTDKIVYLNRVLKFQGCARPDETYMNEVQSRVVGYIDLGDEVNL